jgi:acetyltransferase
MNARPPIRSVPARAPRAASRGGRAADGGPRPATDVRLRPIEAADTRGLLAFYAGLSEESRRTRFFAPTTGIGSGQSTWFCTPDHAHREGFVAVTGSGSAEQIVGHVCVEPDGPAAAEVAIAVADGFQGQGIGRRLVDAAVAWARADGIRVLTASMLAGNPSIQRLLTGLRLPCLTTPVGCGVIEIRIDLGDTRTDA